MSLPNKIQLVATVTVNIEYADTIDNAFKGQLEDFVRDPSDYDELTTQILGAYETAGLRSALEMTSVNLVKEALMEGLSDIVTPEGEQADEIKLDASVTIKTVGEEA